jgi:hypothetical protein
MGPTHMVTIDTDLLSEICKGLSDGMMLLLSTRTGGIEMVEELNPFKIAQKQLEMAAAKLGLDKATTELLKWPMKEYVYTLPLKMDDGSTKILHAYRVQYNNARGHG